MERNSLNGRSMVSCISRISRMLARPFVLSVLKSVAAKESKADWVGPSVVKSFNLRISLRSQIL